MLYSFLSESGVLDISLLALSTGIIVLSILGLLHLGKRRGHNKAGHFSEQPDDCAMPAVQTENSDGWPSMEQPQTTELVSVVAAPEDSSNLDSPPSETVVSEKAGCEAGVCSRTGHTMATFDDIARLQKNISCPGGLRPPRLALCQCPYETENP